MLIITCKLIYYNIISCLTLYYLNIIIITTFIYAPTYSYSGSSVNTSPCSFPQFLNAFNILLTSGVAGPSHK